MSRYCLCVLIATAAMPGVAWAQAKVDDVIRTGEQRIAEGAVAQRQVEKLSDQVGDIEAEYKQVSKVVDGLKIYNGLLQKQVDNQVAEMAALSDSVPPLVNRISAGSAPIAPATVSLASSTATRASRPNACTLDAFPKSCPR